MVVGHRVGERVGRGLTKCQRLELPVRIVAEGAVGEIDHRSLRPGRIDGEGMGVVRVEVRVGRGQQHRIAAILVRIRRDARRRDRIILAVDRHCRGLGRGPAMVVDHRHLVPARCQGVDKIRPDEPGAPCDHAVH